MFSNSRPFIFRFLCLLLSLLLLVNALIIPVRASVLLEVLAATTRNMIASLIRGCGVYVADGISGSLEDGLASWEMLVDFVCAKIPAEYLYINAAGEQLVKMILKDGIYYADRNLIQFVADCLSKPSVNADGEIVQPVGYGYPAMSDEHENQVISILSDCQKRGYEYASYIRNLPYCCVVTFDPVSSSPLYNSPLIIFSHTQSTVSIDSSNSSFDVSIPGGESLYLWTNTDSTIPGNGNLRSSTSSAYNFTISATDVNVTTYWGDITVRPHGGFGGSFGAIFSTYSDPCISTMWSGNSISVTDDRVGGTITALPVSVPESSTIAATTSHTTIYTGSFVDTKTEAVPDTNTGTDVVPDSTTGSDVIPDTDVSTQAGFWATLLSWVETIWTTLKDILSGVLAIPISIAQAIATAIADVIAAIKSLVPEPPTFSDFQIPGLKDFFPFCIPFDLLAMMRALSASPVAPSFVFACPLPSGGIYEVNIDLSAWNGVASTIRSVIVAIYVVTLANATRKFIKW